MSASKKPDIQPTNAMRRFYAGLAMQGLPGIVILGFLLVATVLTLYIVPCLYAIAVETFGVKPIPEGSDVNRK